MNVVSPIINLLPLPNPIIGGIIGLILGIPGSIFGHKFNAYGFGRKQDESN
jgi:hypothetical protein